MDPADGTPLNTGIVSFNRIITTFKLGDFKSEQPRCCTVMYLMKTGQGVSLCLHLNLKFETL